MMAAKKHQTDVKVYSKKSHEIRPKKPTAIPNQRKIFMLEREKDPTMTDTYPRMTKSLKGKGNE